MSTEKSGERPLVDDEVHSSLTGYLKRVLDRATPSSWVSGGESPPTHFKTRPRTYKQLKRREEIYLNGGPITEFVDTRALMTYGTGVSFESESPLEDDQGRTVDEWLADQFGDTLDLVMIDAGIQSYWAGDAWPEIVETRGGEFSHLELIDPTTVDVDWNEHGEITGLTQIVKGPRGKPRRQSLDIDNVGHFTFKDSSGGPLGDSLVEQNMDEIQRYVSNQEQRANAIKLHGSPKYDVKVGAEGQTIPDKIMRKVDRRFRPDRVDENTTWTHGGDIQIETLESPGMGDGMKQITETDISLLAGSFGIPLEWTNFGSAGLGEGAPAKSREKKFERQARTEQTRRGNQLIDQILRPILERYSPFPENVEVDVVFGDVVSDPAAITEWLSTVDWAFHRDEIRDMLGHAAWDDGDDREAPPELVGDSDGGGDGPGLFANDRGRGTGNRNAASDRALLFDSVSDDALTQEELVWRDVIEGALWSDDRDRKLFEFDATDLPDFVRTQLQKAVPAAIAESSLDTLSGAEVGFLENALEDALEDDHGWSLNSITEHIQDIPGADLEEYEAERIGRDITQNAVGKAREDGYRDRDDFEEFRFRWAGPDDHRTTEACEWIAGQVPEEGVPMDQLKTLIQEANDRFVDHDAREWSPHIQCRHQPVRVVNT